MTITLPLEPQKEAQLIALAKQKGVSVDALVGNALDSAVEQILEQQAAASSAKTPKRSLRGLLAKYGPSPSKAEIDQNRAEMFADFPRSDF